MKGFIEVTDKEDTKVLLNIEHIIEIDNYGIVTLTRQIDTKETYNEIKELLNSLEW